MSDDEARSNEQAERISPPTASGPVTDAEEYAFCIAYGIATGCDHPRTGLRDALEAFLAHRAAHAPAQAAQPRDKEMKRLISKLRLAEWKRGYLSVLIHQWFGLTYSAYFVMPRLAMQSLSEDWQRRFVALMNEAAATGLETPTYHVLRQGEEYSREVPENDDAPLGPIDRIDGRRPDPWANYRHGNIRELCPGFDAGRQALERGAITEAEATTYAGAEFAVDDEVQKIGAKPIPKVVIRSVFLDEGEVRYVASIPPYGLLHIYAPSQLRAIDKD